MNLCVNVNIDFVNVSVCACMCGCIYVEHVCFSEYLCELYGRLSPLHRGPLLTTALGELLDFLTLWREV